MIKFLLILLLLLPFSVIFCRLKYAKARKLEKEGKYKDACYEYGVILLNGAIINEKAIKNKIRTLWDTYGPFNFDDNFKKVVCKDGDTPEKCAEAAHAAVVSLIKEAVK